MYRYKVISYGMMGIIILLGLFIQTLWYCIAQSAEHGEKGTGQQSSPIYRPPLRGMPFNREGGATRGDNALLASITAMVPEHIGLTSSDIPTLYWHASRTVDVPVEFVIIDDNAIEPLWQLTMQPPLAAGYHTIHLKDGPCKLVPGKVYKWFIALVVDPGHRSKDIVVSGAIEYVHISDKLWNQIQKASLFERISLYADAGIWYDAVDCLNRFVQSQKGSEIALKMQEDFFRQVGLTPKIH
uniref:DUF928 domain-containing protein n=1 Tax=Desulfatirhabdium butyrativorans TaxID=340467 RepID=A0A7C4RU23_9BACT